MFSRFSIQTRLSTVEAEAILGRLVRPRAGWFDLGHQTSDTRPFVGRIEHGSFKFSRVITGRNSFLPIVIGRVMQAEGGAVVRGHMRMALVVIVFMTFWIGMALSAAIHEVPRRLHAHDLPSAFLVACFPLLGAVLVGFGYYPERRKALRMLTEAFQPK